MAALGVHDSSAALAGGNGANTSTYPIVPAIADFGPQNGILNEYVSSQQEHALSQPEHSFLEDDDAATAYAARVAADAVAASKEARAKAAAAAPTGGGGHTSTTAAQSGTELDDDDDDEGDDVNYDNDTTVPTAGNGCGVDRRILNFMRGLEATGPTEPPVQPPPGYLVGPTEPQLTLSSEVASAVALAGHRAHSVAKGRGGRLMGGAHGEGSSFALELLIQKQKDPEKFDCLVPGIVDGYEEDKRGVVQRKHALTDKTAVSCSTCRVVISVAKSGKGFDPFFLRVTSMLKSIKSTVALEGSPPLMRSISVSS